MKRLTLCLFALWSFAALSTATAQVSDDASQDVTITVQEVNAISVGGAVNIVLDAASPGQAPDPKTASSTYAFTTNSPTERKITGVLDAAFGGSIQLQAELAAPSTGQSAGQKRLSSSQPQDLVTNINPAAESGLGITYTASAGATDAPGDYTQTVTYTILAQ